MHTWQKRPFCETMANWRSFVIRLNRSATGGSDSCPKSNIVYKHKLLKIMECLMLMRIVRVADNRGVIERQPCPIDQDMVEMPGMAMIFFAAF